MAELQSTNINGNLYIGTTQNLTAAGYIWYDTVDNKVYYSANDGDTVVRKELGNSSPTADPTGPSYPLGLTSALITIPAQNNSTWTLRSADISSYVGAQAYVVFRYINGTTGISYQGDVQLDDFNLGGNVFDPETSTHSFQTSFDSAVPGTTAYSSVSWTSLPTGANAYRWNRDPSGTGSSSTGNTSGNTGIYYFYVETSGTSTNGKYYWLRSPLITLSTSTLSFYSAQNGGNCGSIEVYLDVIS